MADSTRARKIADRIKVIVAETLEKRVKDPRLGFVTITEVRVTGDLQNATVFYTVFGDDDQLQATKSALNSAKGLLRSAVGRGLQIRLTPTLEFVADQVPAAAAELDELLAQAAARDAEVAALAAGAAPAGDPDPYRKPRSDEDTGGEARRGDQTEDASEER
jgi:ribosome-binding factor A